MVSLRGADAGRAPRFGADVDDVTLLRAGTRFAVYRARETGSGRAVLIKVPDLAGPSWLHDSLEHEGRILAALAGAANVVTLLRRLHTDDGRPALMLENCPGSLSDLPEDEPMPAADAAAIGVKIAAALEAVHQLGYVHCAVRPAAVLCAEGGEPVLARFDDAAPFGDNSAGIAAATGRSDARGAADDVPLSTTTAHTAPELLEGAPPTPASDVYGLASTLYELVAGRAAFREYAGESVAAMIVRVLSNPVRPITAPGVPLELSDLLTWAMSGDPGRRPPTPAWIGEELRRIARREGWPQARAVGV